LQCAFFAKIDDSRFIRIECRTWQLASPPVAAQRENMIGNLEASGTAGQHRPADSAKDADEQHTNQGKDYQRRDAGRRDREGLCHE
jgi:hypothetical protein